MNMTRPTANDVPLTMRGRNYSQIRTSCGRAAINISLDRERFI